MDKYLWLFPVLFIFHDFEEIIGLGIWFKNNNKKISEKYPKIFSAISKMYAEYSTEGMALAVFEEFVLCVLVCLIATFSGFYLLWIGAVIAFIFHMIMHIGQSVMLKSYVPALATSIIATPVSIYVLVNSLQLFTYSAGQIVLWSIIGLLIIAVNLKFSHSLMHKFTRWINKRIKYL